MFKMPRRFHPLWVSLVFLIYSMVATSAIVGDNTSLQAAYQAAYPGLFRVMPEPELSVDGNTISNAVPPVILLHDPNPAAAIKNYQTDPFETESDIAPPAESNATGLDQSEAVAAAATFVIDYVPSGGQDPWGEDCQTFPESAKPAFNAAAAVWSGILQSSVPIRIRACWANLGSSSILGYSGGGTIHRNFTNAPQANTWYVASLANSLAGSDLATSNYDMHITYNSNFSWYYGTDGNPPYNQHDLMSVVLHEIGHGLNVSGSMDYLGGIGYWGYGESPTNPDIYDTFMKNGAGTFLTSYGSGTTALGTQLVSNNIWFHGANAMSANGGARVKMYAPSTWNPGSSYSHLDYNTFNDTVNELMVYMFSSGEAVHDPGPVTKGLLKDLGWVQSGQPDFVVTGITLTPSSPAANGTFSATVTVKNQGTASGSGGWLDVWTHQPTNQSCGVVGNKYIPVGTLAAGASASFTLTNLSAGAAGSKTFRAYVDSYCGTAESNENNNQYTKTYTVGGSTARPDFVVTGITLTPSSPAANGTFSATVTVKNQGTASGSGQWLDVWTHQPTSQSCGAAGNQWTWVGELAAGASASFTFTGLSAGAAGNKTFRAYVDSYCGTVESNEGNNQRTQTYKVIQPDFVVTGVTLTPSSPAANGTFSAKVTVKNQGTASGSGQWLDVWTHQPTSQSCGAAGNKWTWVGELAAGASASFTFTGLSAGAAGNKTFRAYVDSYCGTVESNEGNNQYTKTYTVK